MSEAEERQTQSTHRLIQMLKLEISTQSRIASIDPVDIRRYAMEVISASVSIDENIQRLLDQLPTNQSVRTLKKEFLPIKPTQMKLIRAAKKQRQKSLCDI